MPDQNDRDIVIGLVTQAAERLGHICEVDRIKNTGDVICFNIGREGAGWPTGGKYIRVLVRINEDGTLRMVPYFPKRVGKHKLKTAKYNLCDEDAVRKITDWFRQFNRLFKKPKPVRKKEKGYVRRR